MISLFINELPPLTTFSERDKFLVDSVYTLAAEMSTLRSWMFDSAVVPSITATNLIVTNLSALSSRFATIDVTNYELSGFKIAGQLNIDDSEQNTYALNISATNAIILPVGTTNQRPNWPGLARRGSLRFNTEDNTFEGHNGTEWGALGETTQNVFVDIGAGNIAAGDTVLKGTSLQDLVNSLFIKTFFPTKIDPSASTSFSLASIVEAGTTGVTITVNFDDGQILGRTTTWNPPSNVSGVWNPSTVQNASYAGAPTTYIINGSTITTSIAVAAATFGSTVIQDGTNTFSSTVNYSQGPIPYDSKGNDYSVGLPRRSASNVSTAGSITGARRIWYGTGVSPLTINETNIRNIANSVFTTAPNSTNNFTIIIPAGTVYVVIAAPTDVGGPTIISTGGGIQTDVTAAFLEDPRTTTLQVRGVNNFEGTRSAYTIYYYQPVVAFTENTTYQVTI
jgi:hypothetical protein